jgi:methylated-DNA-[protein]-cysteine S-methyltransferase
LAIGVRSKTERRFEKRTEIVHPATPPIHPIAKLDKITRAPIVPAMPSHSFPTTIGPCSIAWENDSLSRFILLDETSTEPTPPDWIHAIITRVQQHLEQGNVDFSDCPLAWDSVTNFQSQVYRAALEVKSGLTATYGDLARAIGQPPGASRAVGTALGQNPWPLIVPCHRFVGANGKMTGFSGNGGIATKLKLLAIEGSELFGE